MLSEREGVNGYGGVSRVRLATASGATRMSLSETATTRPVKSVARAAEVIVQTIDQGSGSREGLYDATLLEKHQDGRWRTLFTDAQIYETGSRTSHTGMDTFRGVGTENPTSQPS